MTPHPWQTRIRFADLVRRYGKVRRMRSTFVEADGPGVPLGTLCQIARRDPAAPHAMAEVIAVDPTGITLAPFEDIGATEPSAIVTALPTSREVPVGDVFCGRMVDSLGRPLDGKAAPVAGELGCLFASGPSPMMRAAPTKVLETGVRAIDGLLTLAQGQRVGVFAAAGVGKTSILHQLTTQVVADRIVIALIGERGHEVEKLWAALPVATRGKTAMVAATSDQPAILRARAGAYAMTLAEYWRGRGHNVLLLIDSITRLAMALREIGLAAGEPPTVRAYTPNVFAAIPRLIERAGALRSGGAISAIMTVLAETDDLDDPICEMMKSLLDGHFLLTRSLADQGHFPAIDISRSISRQARAVSSVAVQGDAQTVTAWLSAYEETRTLRQAGLYAVGNDNHVDQAVQHYPDIVQFLRQPSHEKSALADTFALLRHLAGSQ